ncbi:MAG: hypothetical protein DDT40_00900 [candidate division WS2 bacterium]|nr:hypothetical protein [Candidatus Psychracetigena formicireducens]
MIKRMVKRMFGGLRRGIDVSGTHMLAGQKRQYVWTRHKGEEMMNKEIRKLGLGVFVFVVLFLGSSLLFAQEPVGWFLFSGQPIGTEASLSTDFHSGKYSAYVKTTTNIMEQDEEGVWVGGGTTGWSYNIGPLLKPNSKYILSGWVKTNLEEGAGIEFSIHLLDNSPDSQFYGYVAGHMHGMNNWTYKTTTIKTPSTIARANILFVIHRKGEGWLDDVALIDVSTGKNLLTNPGFEFLK